MPRLTLVNSKKLLPTTIICLFVLPFVTSICEGQQQAAQYAPSSGGVGTLYEGADSRYQSDVYAGSNPYSQSTPYASGRSDNPYAAVQTNPGVNGSGYNSAANNTAMAPSRSRVLGGRSGRIRNQETMSAAKAQQEVRIDPPSSPATTRKPARQNAEAAIAQMNIAGKDRIKVQGILEDVSIYRRLPVYAVDCNLDMMNLLVQKPEIIVGLWERMEISQIQVQQFPGQANYYAVEDAAGTKGYLQYIWRSNNTALCYIDGRYEGSMLPRPVRGRGLVLIRLQPQYLAPGKAQVLCYVDSFLSFDQEMVDLVSRLFNPMLGRVADNNLEQTLAFVNWFSKSCKTNPQAVSEYMLGLDRASGEVKIELSRQIWNLAKQNGFNAPDEMVQAYTANLLPPVESARQTSPQTANVPVTSSETLRTAETTSSADLLTQYQVQKITNPESAVSNGYVPQKVSMSRMDLNVSGEVSAPELPDSELVSPLRSETAPKPAVESVPLLPGEPVKPTPDSELALPTDIILE